jgi:CDP-diacylglycerol--serine O-phosphatidyltransferase
MKHIPNILTLGNLFFGCVAITLILSTEPHLITTDGGSSYYPIIMGPSAQLIWGSICILIAAFFDVLDGMMARVLKAFSPLGKDLDSLADLVSFGVAPAMILYKMLWMAEMAVPNAMDGVSWQVYLAFLLPCFGALRLARFNQQHTGPASWFSGMPIPAAGIIVALLPIIIFYQNSGIMPNLSADIANFIQKKWVIIGFTLLLSILMVSRAPFLKWKSPKPGIKGWWAHITIVIAGILGYLLIGYAGLLIAFVVYIIVSKLYQYPEPSKFAV